MTGFWFGKKPCIYTFTGRLVNHLDIRPEDVDIRDIAHALACTNRFCGHAKKPVSVAYHSYFVSMLCSPEAALQGLLHDASEAYLGDVTTFLKASPEMSGYRAMERRTQRVIFETFGCDQKLHSSVRAADEIMLRLEAEYSFPEDITEWWRLDVPLLTRRLQPQKTAEDRNYVTHRGYAFDRPYWDHVDWEHAEGLFLARFEALTCQKITTVD